MLQLLSSDRSVEEMREVLRARLVSCMKAGDKLLLRLKVSYGAISPTCAPVHVHV